MIHSALRFVGTTERWFAAHHVIPWCMTKQFSIAQIKQAVEALDKSILFYDYGAYFEHGAFKWQSSDILEITPAGWRGGYRYLLCRLAKIKKREQFPEKFNSALK